MSKEVDDIKERVIRLEERESTTKGRLDAFEATITKIAETITETAKENSVAIADVGNQVKQAKWVFYGVVATIVAIAWFSGVDLTKIGSLFI